VLKTTGRRSVERRAMKNGAAPCVGHCLKIIKVSQNYRDRAIGSALVR